MATTVPFLTLVLTIAAIEGGCTKRPSSPSSTPASAPVVSTTPPAMPVDSQPSFTRLASAPSSGFAEPTEQIIRDDATLAATWLTLHNGLPGVSAPKVDFQRSSVILLALGTRRTGGFAIRFDNVARGAGGAAVVHYTVTSPGSGCMTTQMMSAPVDIVSVPRLADQVQFQRTDVVDRC